VVVSVVATHPLVITALRATTTVTAVSAKRPRHAHL
jgi:hypothetical protein